MLHRHLNLVGTATLLLVLGGCTCFVMPRYEDWGEVETMAGTDDLEELEWDSEANHCTMLATIKVLHGPSSHEEMPSNCSCDNPWLKRGTPFGAMALLRNEALELGADTVQIRGISKTIEVLRTHTVCCHGEAYEARGLALRCKPDLAESEEFDSASLSKGLD